MARGKTGGARRGTEKRQTRKYGIVAGNGYGDVYGNGNVQK